MVSSHKRIGSSTGMPGPCSAPSSPTQTNSERKKEEGCKKHMLDRHKKTHEEMSHKNPNSSSPKTDLRLSTQTNSGREKERCKKIFALTDQKALRRWITKTLILILPSPKLSLGERGSAGFCKRRLLLVSSLFCEKNQLVFFSQLLLPLSQKLPKLVCSKLAIILLLLCTNG